jgi:hypothetical protein
MILIGWMLQLVATAMPISGAKLADELRATALQQCTRAQFQVAVEQQEVTDGFNPHLPALETYFRQILSMCQMGSSNIGAMFVEVGPRGMVQQFYSIAGTKGVGERIDRMVLMEFGNDRKNSGILERETDVDALSRYRGVRMDRRYYVSKNDGIVQAVITRQEIGPLSGSLTKREEYDCSVLIEGRLKISIDAIPARTVERVEALLETIVQKFTILRSKTQDQRERNTVAPRITNDGLTDETPSTYLHGLTAALLPGYTIRRYNVQVQSRSGCGLIPIWNATLISGSDSVPLEYCCPWHAEGRLKQRSKRQRSIETLTIVGSRRRMGKMFLTGSATSIDSIRRRLRPLPRSWVDRLLRYPSVVCQ